MRRHTVSFKHAFDGIVYVFTTQPNFRFHTIATVVVLTIAWLLQVTTTELLILLLAIMLVLIAEMLNTAVEAMTDLLTTQKNQYAKISKDVAAGMVLMSAMLATIIGGTIFFPYILTLIAR